MSDMVSETAERLFSAPRTDDGEGGLSQAFWAQISDAGLPLGLLDESAGGFGLTAREALSIARIAAAHAAKAPAAETMLANWILANAGLDLAEGPATIAFGLTLGKDLKLSGELQRVPWGRDAASIVLLTQDRKVIHLSGGWECRHGLNLADEPRDDLIVDCTLRPGRAADANFDPKTYLALCAMLRVASISGAAQAALGLTVTYANDRVQFGKPIGKNQAIQQNLAIMATQVAAACAAADMVAAAFPPHAANEAIFQTIAAAAKLRAGEAAGICASIAHQVHGAIGFTHEYQLHPLTKRLWSWRDEFGSENHWAEEIADAFFSEGDVTPWDFLTRQD
ncbi:Acyl-CoA dehydrogenase [Mesorhizobium escarrei]|uniref:Acyl-CoA dehydrogenase n=2 Tax=Mesorhizobium escarrei TaxID=666018 RepID=A0ABM9E665_9HYPH|nr:Acyl-CoA dehydrogenase [Mesorhizobium escarrei]